MVAATAVADLAAQALKEVSSQLQQNPPPPLPSGWILKESRSQPNMYYYYNQETGESDWNPPLSLIPMDEEAQEEDENYPQKSFLETLQPVKHDPVKTDPDAPSSRKRSVEDTSFASSNKRPVKLEDFKIEVEKNRKASTAPSQVRVLHILKKHKDSRRPTSWRTNNKKITISRDEAVEELQGLLEILQEEESNPENLIATFKELASQESDCSSAKRHGDLGFFGRKKMRPEFEEAAFGLGINQLSAVVETASGAHILLRLE